MPPELRVLHTLQSGRRLEGKWASGILKDDEDPSVTKRSQRWLVCPCIVHIEDLLLDLWSQTLSVRQSFLGFAISVWF